jgi:hypothetical protein
MSWYEAALEVELIFGKPESSRKKFIEIHGVTRANG